MLTEWYPNEKDPQLGIFIQKHAKAIAENKDVSLIYVEGTLSIKQDYIINNYQDEHLNVVHVKFKKAKGVFKYANFFRYRMALQRAFLSLDLLPDMVHIHVPGRNSFLASFLNKKYEVPFIITEHWHGWLKGYYQKSFWRKRWIYSLLKKSKAVTVVSKPLKESIENFMGSEKLNLHIIPNIVESNTENQELIKRDGNRILTVADLDDKTKNISGLLKAFNTFSDQYPEWELDIVGDGPDRNDLEALCKELKNSDKIHFLGRQVNSEVLKLYPQYKFYVCNSNTETFGISIAEALMAGVPVICTKCGGPEDFLNSENSILIQKNSEDELVEALNQMSIRHQNFNKTQLKDSVKQYSGASISKQFLELYDKIL